ncbi:DNA starvation/stationary phase protection protein Dps [Roseococcus sp. SYP-B2431]|uniref:DNA starvation/stationary phase protection protein Dps n=1 Tax=Roseococcus sp. SYP-B2431 TaxID=2496640 RepID=UPI00103C353A|nr:DNA starvation/stationary phase protection protein Dps [Roseococcus sp. SYP-B2431]TCH96344.1 DNA starvation/stationary phase protection protein Dps [Roseococcus sp. SYP-B2431]
MAKLAKTRNTLGENARLTSVGLLNAALADLMDLTNAVRMAHWNVKGPQFAALHAKFEEFYDQLGGAVDDTAERIVQLGGTPAGTTQQVGAATRLAPYPADLKDGLAHVAALADRYGALAATSREAIDAAAEAGDADTADLFTATSRLLDKALWMLEAHLA